MGDGCVGAAALGIASQKSELALGKLSAYNFGNHEFYFQRVALLRLKLKEPVMGNFRGYISAVGVLTMVMRGCAGLMVKICGKSFLYELQNCWEVKMGKGLL